MKTGHVNTAHKASLNRIGINRIIQTASDSTAINLELRKESEKNPFVRKFSNTALSITCRSKEIATEIRNQTIVGRQHLETSGLSYNGCLLLGASPSHLQTRKQLRPPGRCLCFLSDGSPQGGSPFLGWLQNRQITLWLPSWLPKQLHHFTSPPAV